MKQLCFAIFGNSYQANKSSCIHELIALLEERKARLFIDSTFYHYLTSELSIHFSPEGLIEGSDFCADFVISMGGDGTFLEAARRVGNKGIPVLGINMGRLGFLSDYQSEDIASAILTNVQLYRLYIERYLRHHPDVNQDLDIIVTQKEATAYGLPIEVYFFTRDKAWAVYERKQSDIFDHLLSMASECGLKLYQLNM